MNSYNGTLKIERDIQEDLQSIKLIDGWIINLTLIAILFIPLLIGASSKEFVSPTISQYQNLKSGLQGDIFTFYKFIGLTLYGITIFGLLLYKILFINYSLSKLRLSIGIVFFIVYIIINSLLSPYYSLTYLGMPNHFDGTMTYILYSLIILALLNIEVSSISKKLVSIYIIPAILLNLLLSTLNFLGIKLLEYSSVIKLLTLFESNNTNINVASQFYGTLNQVNYMSGFFGMLSIGFLVLSLVEKRINYKIFSFFVSLLASVIVIQSFSLSGIVTILVTYFLFLVIVLINKTANIKSLSILSVLYFVFIIVFILLHSIKNPLIFDEYISSPLKIENPFIIELSSSINHKVYASNELELPPIPDQGLSGGSGRLYIWEETFEAIKQKPIIGYGLDTFSYGFNQEDVNKINGMTTYDILIDKPHSYYLYLLYSLGIIGFVSIIYLFLFPYFLLIKNKIKIINSHLYFYLATWTGFLIQSLFNDSNIGNTLVPMILLILFINDYSKNEIEN